MIDEAAQESWPLPLVLEFPRAALPKIECRLRGEVGELGVLGVGPDPVVGPELRRVGRQPLTSPGSIRVSKSSSSGS